MNIQDVESQKIDGCRLSAIFNRQRELMEKYHHIEASNGLLLDPGIPVKIHHPLGQARLKDFAWRTTEELAEALDAYDQYSRGDEDDIIHAQEEVADSLHFLVEFCILSGYTPDLLIGVLPKSSNYDRMSVWWEEAKVQVSPSRAVARFVQRLGMVTHLLKNKPWKTTHMQTDINTFGERLKELFFSFPTVAHSFYISTPDNLADLYFRKSEVNKFRQRSGY